MKVCSLNIMQTTKIFSIMSRYGSEHKLIDQVNNIEYDRSSKSEIGKAANQFAVECGIRERLAIKGSELQINLQRNRNSLPISSSNITFCQKVSILASQ